MFKLKEKTVELIFLSIMYLAMLSYYHITLFGENIHFVDTDDFMRVVRMREFFNNFDLNNHIISRSNYPYGCELHWSRLYDFFIIGLTWFIDFFVDSLKKSIDYACFIISPILGLISMIFISKTFRNFVKKRDVFLATALFCASPYLLLFFRLGRPDHHAFITLCILIYIYYVTKLISNKNEDKYTYIKTAISAAACVWASPETLVVLLLTNIVLFLVYREDFEKTSNLCFTNLLTSCLVCIIVMIPDARSQYSHNFSICILLLLIPYISLKPETLRSDLFFKYWHYVCLLFMMFFLTRIQPVEYDKVSIVHATLFLCLATFFAVNVQLIGRKDHMYDAVTWAFVIGCVFLSMFPRFFMGMSADIPQFAKEVWLNRVQELLSPFAEKIFCPFLIYSIITVTAIVVKIQEIKNRKLERTNIIWILFLTLASSYLILACFACRMIPYSVIFGLPIIVNLGMSSKYVRSFDRFFRMIITISLTCLFLLISTAFLCGPDRDPDSQNPGYSDRELFDFVDNLSHEPAIIMAHSNHGSKLLYYTKHYVLGAPYHRQVEGILASYFVTEMNNNLNVVRKVLKKTNTQYIFVDHRLEKQFPHSFASSILSGQIPKWLNAEKIPTKFGGHSIFKVDQKILSQEIESKD